MLLLAAGSLELQLYRGPAAYTLLRLVTTYKVYFLTPAVFCPVRLN